MKRWVFCGVLVLLAGCVALPKMGPLGNGLDPAGKPLYLSSPDVQKEQLENFLSEYPDPDDSLKIEYLLTAVQNSSCRFIRNGVVANGDEAMQWLRWKMHHKQYADCPILTPDDFVNRVADISRNSGLPYEVLYPDNHREKLQTILQHELDGLEARLKRE
ncbi:MAG TPA: DUF5329 family protein [Candidatus Omnitrophota bacterium]|nr:DUF5329 family protein [Candidatus Omnitrophota bacterium]